MLTQQVIKRGLGLTDAEVRLLPSTAYVTRCGHTCLLYGTRAILLGMKRVKMSGGRRRLLKANAERSGKRSAGSIESNVTFRLTPQ